MQSLDMEPNQEEKLEKLSQDFDTPFCPPYDIKETIPKDYPALDTNIDDQEWYDAGASVASAAHMVTSKSIIGYNRPSTIRLRK